VTRITRPERSGILWSGRKVDSPIVVMNKSGLMEVDGEVGWRVCWDVRLDILLTFIYHVSDG
jgi:hypothetical protein